MANIDIVDRSEMTEKLLGMLELDPVKTAIVTIDMHRGHLDPAVATMPASTEDAERVIKNSRGRSGLRPSSRRSNHPREAGLSQDTGPGKRGNAGQVLESTA